MPESCRVLFSVSLDTGTGHTNEWAIITSRKNIGRRNKIFVVTLKLGMIPDGSPLMKSCAFSGKKDNEANNGCKGCTKT